MLYRKDWVIFAIKTFCQTKHVKDYFGRYSHRVAITKRRIKNIDNGKVTAEYKDYKQGAIKKEMKIDTTEFIKRFCIHILPSRYRKIRTFAFLSNASKATSIPIARKALHVKHDHLLTKAQRKEKAIENYLAMSTFTNVLAARKELCK